MDSTWFSSFQEKLDRHYAWPSLYMFKFIIPASKKDELQRLFPLHVTTEKMSGKGKYISLTYQMMMPSSESVINVYKKASAVEGLVAL